jgi:hypothetical protein
MRHCVHEIPTHAPPTAHGLAGHSPPHHTHMHKNPPNEPLYPSIILTEATLRPRPSERPRLFGPTLKPHGAPRGRSTEGASVPLFLRSKKICTLSSSPTRFPLYPDPLSLSPSPRPHPDSLLTSSHAQAEATTRTWGCGGRVGGSGGACRPRARDAVEDAEATRRQRRRTSQGRPVRVPRFTRRRRGSTRTRQGRSVLRRRGLTALNLAGNQRRQLSYGLWRCPLEDLIALLF